MPEQLDQSLIDAMQRYQNLGKTKDDTAPADNDEIQQAIKRYETGQFKQPQSQQYERPKILGHEDEPELTLEQSLSQAYHNAPQSAAAFAESFAYPFTHPSETFEGVKQIGKGLYSKGEGYFKQQDPEEKAKNEALINEMGKELAQDYGSWKGFKSKFARDPFSTLADVSMIPTMGGTAVEAAGAKLARTAGTAGKLGETLQKTGAATRTTGELMNPATAALKAGTAAVDATTNAASGLSSMATGAAPTAVKDAFTAGTKYSTDFLKHWMGHGDQGDIFVGAKNAVNALKDDAKADYLKGKGQLEAGKILPSQRLNDSLTTAQDLIAPKGFVTAPKDAVQTFQEGQKIINDFTSHPNWVGDAFDYDRLKIALGNNLYAPGMSGEAKAVATMLKNSARDTIIDHSPIYAKTLMGYSDAASEINNIVKNLGLGPRGTEAQALKKILSNKAGLNNRALLEQLAEKDPSLLHKIAGEQLRSFFPEDQIRRSIFGAGAPVLGMGAFQNFFDPTYLSALLGASPKVAGGVGYLTGAATAPIVRPMRYFSTGKPSMATYIPHDVGQARMIQEEMEGRQGRATGGKVDHASAEKIADQLVAAFARAKKDEDLESKVLLNKPDEVIIDALKEAKKAI
jgi:hypothetical protein